MKNSKVKSLLLLLITFIVIGACGFIAAVGIGERHSGSAKNIQLGLDLEGGVSITYQVVNDNFSQSDFNDTIHKLQLRVDSFSTESEVYSEGDDRIVVDIPGQTDANAVLEDLGKPGSLYFVTDVTDEYDESTCDYEIYTVDDTIYRVWVSGEDIADAQGTTETDSTTGATEYVVSLEMTTEGASKFEEATTENYGSTIAILYDDEIISAPTVQAVISNGKAVINGQESLEEAETLASTIRIGTLSVELEELSHRVVSAKLGADALAKSLKAGLIGILIVIIFMILVYRGPGIAAGIALGSYMAFILLILNAFDMTLSLSGIAGIILSIGMAVDANVIIYARIREEIADGRDVGKAIDIGFKKATSAIVDGNITTFIASLVLMWKGSGTIQGFAQTLAVGILLSMFTALVVSRIVVKCFYNLGIKSPILYGKEKARKVIDFVGKNKIFYIISIIAVLAGFVTMGINSSKGNGAFYYSIEFQGGQSITVEFDKDYTINEFNDEIKPAIAEVVGTNDIQGQKDTSNNSFVIKTKSMDEDTFESFKKLLIDEYGAVDSDENFDDTFISATVGSEMRRDAVIATILATICMLIYIWFRFKDIRFAASAVIALLHDVLVVLAFYAISRTTVGTTFIACMLTIVGYSINATIVIFDRIRENLKLTPAKNRDVKEIVNRSITQTLTRSIYTSFTTFITIAMIYVLGVTSIKEFALPMMVGIIVGAYSSVCITGSLWYVMVKATEKKKEK